MEYLPELRSWKERIGMMIWPTDPRALVNVLVEIEDAGVRQVWLPVGWPGNPDLMTVLAAAAERTTHLTFGTAIIQVFSRHPALRTGAAAVGRPRPPIIAHVPVALTEDRATALRAGREGLGGYLGSPFYRKMLIAAGFSIQEIDAVADTLLERLLVYGNASQIKDQLLAILERGIDALVIGPVWVSDAAQETTQLAQMIGQL